MDNANEIAGRTSWIHSAPQVRIFKKTVGGAGPVPICFEAEGFAVVAPHPE